MLPIKNTQLELKCKNYIDKAYEDVRADGFYNSHNHTTKFDEFLVLQVIKSGMTIEIVPTLFEFYAISNSETYMFSTVKESSAVINYQHMKYALNSGHIKSIMNKLDQEVY